MNTQFLKIGPPGSGLRWLQWVAILIAVGLFALLSLLITVLFPHSEHHGATALIGINGAAALLAALIAPYLMRSYERMQQRMERQYSELRTLHAIDKAINSQMDIKAIGQIAITESTQATDAEVGVFVLWREGRVGQIEERVVYGISDAMMTLLGGALDNRLQLLATAHASEHQEDLDQTWQKDQLNSSLKLRNMIVLPVSYQDRPLGLLLLGNRGGALMPGQGFTDDDRSLLEAVAGTVGVAVQNARYVRETRRRGEMLRALVAHTGQAIADSSDTSRLMHLFADSASRLLGCQRVAVYALDEANELFLPLAAADLRTGQGEDARTYFKDQTLPAGLVLLGLRADGRPDAEPRAYAETQKALLLPSGSGDFLAGAGTVFLLTARDRRCQGLLVFGDLPTGQEVADFAVALASQASVTLENAHLFSDLNQLYQREKRIAENLQKNLLPDIPPRVGNFEFAQEYRAALSEAEIGGDFLDLFALGANRVGIVMADVSGKGLRAAVQTAAVKYTLRAFAHHLPAEPSRVLSLVNDVLCSRLNSLDGFITLFFGTLDTETGEMIWCSAGHEPPLVCRAADQSIMTLDNRDGMVLGCLPGAEYEDTVLHLDPGDLLLLYTDGVTESRDGDGDFLGLEGLKRFLSPSPSSQSASACLQRLCARLRAFSEDDQRDDIAILLVRSMTALTDLPLPDASFAAPDLQTDLISS